MAINKVVYGGDTLIDLTSDTVTPPKLKIGAVAHAANGSAIEGELAGVYYGETAPDPSDAPVWIKPDGEVDDFITTSDVKYKIYNSVTDLELTSGSATIAGAYSAMSAGEILICNAGAFSSAEVPNTTGVVTIVKTLASYRAWIDFHGRYAANGDYRMFLNSEDEPTGTWIPVNYTLLETAQDLSIGTNTDRMYIRITDSSGTLHQIVAKTDTLSYQTQASGGSWVTHWTK